MRTTWDKATAGRGPGEYPREAQDRLGVPDMRWGLDHHPRAAARARHVTRALLENWQGLDADTVESVLLVVSELVTNAVQHALPPVALHLRGERDGPAVWICVTDGGPSRPDRLAGPGHEPRRAGEGGRGLLIISSLASAYGALCDTDRTSRWACVHREAGGGHAI
jgi:anti-sigma regulatory factor (Ser/Thr protein kinase)